ncbi:hypothetical protein IGI04_012563 [Brassica rapa subsp. trilocularis]|uniref:Uncharacterized protein n=1 Tax=Brassica rapa subsp. trilocularis TaxID=1813537 RepID=A0ABQ7N6B5_BRACM|nr:hypothetical protein IGI04_012563 [Brassica rapa subsp. trilocularis]
MSTTNQKKFNPKSICLPQLTRSDMQHKRWRTYNIATDLNLIANMKEMRLWWSFMSITLTNSNESPLNFESARSLEELMTSDEFEWKTMLPRWMEEQYTVESVA